MTEVVCNSVVLPSVCSGPLNDLKTENRQRLLKTPKFLFKWFVEKAAVTKFRFYFSVTNKLNFLSPPLNESGL